MNENRFGINNLQLLMCHKTKPNQTKPIRIWPAESTSYDGNRYSTRASDKKLIS